MSQANRRKYTIADIEALPDFIRVQMFDGELYTDDFTELEVDEEVFKNKPSETKHVTYRLSVVKAEDVEPEEIDPWEIVKNYRKNEDV